MPVPLGTMGDARPALYTVSKVGIGAPVGVGDAYEWGMARAGFLCAIVGVPLVWVTHLYLSRLKRKIHTMDIAQRRHFRTIYLASFIAVAAEAFLLLASRALDVPYVPGLGVSSVAGIATIASLVRRKDES